MSRPSTPLEVPEEPPVNSKKVKKSKLAEKSTLKNTSENGSLAPMRPPSTRLRLRDRKRLGATPLSRLARINSENAKLAEKSESRTETPEVLVPENLQPKNLYEKPQKPRPVEVVTPVIPPVRHREDVQSDSDETTDELDPPRAEIEVSIIL